MIIGFCCSKKDGVLNTETNRTPMAPGNRRSGPHFINKKCNKNNILRYFFHPDSHQGIAAPRTIGGTRRRRPGHAESVRPARL
jgi:hypothetical protein